ncbi:MAG TPA: pectate lyase [Polyangiaceae bacterium]|jgi:PelA/Pel-15E family pectate lyase
MARPTAQLAIAVVLMLCACRAHRSPEPKASAAVSSAVATTAASASAGHEEHPIDGNAQNFFSEGELARLSPEERPRWLAYLEHSAKQRELDRALIASELRALGRSEMVTAPYRKAFRLEPEMTADWLKSEEGRRFTDNLRTFQTPSGGWSKRTEFKDAPRAPGMSFYSENTSFHYTATIDNDSTTEELRYLARAEGALPDPRNVQAFRRGVDYLLAAQYPNGCFPQVYPLQGGYHDAATYNDNATVNALRLLGDVASGALTLATVEQNPAAASAVQRGLDCIVKSQVRKNGVATVWGQQHHPLTLEPVAARRYELAALCGRESAWVTEYLMDLAEPNPDVVAAVHASIDWYRAHALHGLRYEHQVLSKADGAPPLWARLYELDTDRPIFSNRDGIKRYDWNELTDRRAGYTWYSEEPAKVLQRYPAWAKLHPRRAP